MAKGRCRMKKLKLLLVLCASKAEVFSVNNNVLTFLKRYTHTGEISIHDARRKTLSGFVVPTSVPSHYFDPHESLKTVERRRFCRKISHKLSKMVNELNVSEILISADPKSLGELRKHLEHSIANKIITEIPKHLTHFSTKKLEDYLQRRKKRKYLFDKSLG